jgi:hypothetical protein
MMTLVRSINSDGFMGVIEYSFDNIKKTRSRGEKDRKMVSELEHHKLKLASSTSKKYPRIIFPGDQCAESMGNTLDRKQFQYIKCGK